MKKKNLNYLEQNVASGHTSNQAELLVEKLQHSESFHGKFWFEKVRGWACLRRTNVVVY